MPKFLIEASYSAEGAKGLLEEGGSGRRAAIEQAMEGLGGRVEALYFALEGSRAYMIMEAPDAASVAALSLAASAAGVATVSTVPLLTPEEMDEACQKAVNYRPPGG